MLASVVALSTSSFVPPAIPSRPAVRCDAALMSEDVSSRRELFARAGAAVFAASAAQSASAKAGQFSKLSIFGITGGAISEPFQPGGPVPGQIPTEVGQAPTATYGYKKSDGPILAQDYKADVERERKAFEVSSKIVRSQGDNLDKKTWWLVRDNLRGQAYNMKANMLALNGVLPAAEKDVATKAYKKFWSEINQLDLACVKKEYDLAKKEYGDVLEALDAYTKLI